MAAPFIGPVSIRDYLPSGQIEQVIAGGENYDGSRPLDFAWVKNLYDECVAFNTTFCFIETGSCFVKDGRVYHIPDKGVQSRQAFKSGLQYQGKPQDFKLAPPVQSALFGNTEVYRKSFRRRCDSCGSRLICNGCSDCGRCAD